MIQLISRRNALRTGLLASGGLAVLSQLGKAASPLTTSKEETNKAIVGRWFTDFWGKTGNLGLVDELAAPDLLLRYSLHKPRRDRPDIKAFMFGFRQAFPNLDFWGAADLIAEGDNVVAGKAAAHTRVRLSMISSSDRCRQRPAGRCISEARPC
jgi:hypothetical protein